MLISCCWKFQFCIIKNNATNDIDIYYEIFLSYVNELRNLRLYFIFVPLFCQNKCCLFFNFTNTINFSIKIIWLFLTYIRDLRFQTPSLSVTLCSIHFITQFETKKILLTTNFLFHFQIPSIWTDWSDWSECSRSCDGGISHQRRACRLSHCEGNAFRYKICNMQVNFSYIFT